MMYFSYNRKLQIVNRVVTPSPRVYHNHTTIISHTVIAKITYVIYLIQVDSQSLEVFLKGTIKSKRCMGTPTA